MLQRLCRNNVRSATQLSLHTRAINTTVPYDYSTVRSVRNFFIPTIIEREGNFENRYDIFTRLLKDRIVCVMGVFKKKKNQNFSFFYLVQCVSKCWSRFSDVF